MSKKNGQYCVNGKCYATRAEARKYQIALEINAREAGTPEVESKDYYDESMMSMPAKLDPNDPRANYGPLRGSDTKACANCQWFCAHNASCDLLYGDIVATGGCDLWLEEASPPGMTPIPVTIVESAEAKPGLVESSPILSWLVRTFGKKDSESLGETGFKALPDNKWVSFYTNNFEDKTGQIFSEKAHDQYIEWLDKGLIPYPELWYWHIPGTKHGQAEWIGREGHIVIAAGSFDNTPMADLFRKEYNRNPHRTSHTYGAPKGGHADGVYQAYFTVEISPLPAGKEANAITTFMEVKEMPITPEKRDKLAAILGPELASKTLGDAEQVSKKLEEAGFKFKEAETVIPMVDADARDAIQSLAVLNKEAVDAVANKLGEQLGQIVTGIRALQDAEAARNAKVVELETFVKEQFKLESQATRNAGTVVAETDPQLKQLQSKQLGTQPSQDGDVFSQITGMVLTKMAPTQQS
jgi:hypothetical protein